MHKPGGHGAVDERRITAPAEGVGVLDLGHVHQAARGLEVGHDLTIGVLDVPEARGGGGGGSKQWGGVGLRLDWQCVAVGGG